MTMTEFWWEFEHRHKEQRAAAKGLGGHSMADWDRVRAEHKAKLARKAV